MSNTTHVSDLTDQELANAYYNWDCDMAHAFNGRDFPKAYHKPTRGGKIEGMIGFSNFKAYCLSRGVI